MRAITQAFERYHRERLTFVGSLADLSKQEHNVELIEGAGGLQLLHSLLDDPTPGVKCTASLALGRLAMQSETASKKLIAYGALGILIKLLGTTPGEDATKRREALAMRRAAAYALRGIAKHGIGASRAVTEAGGIQVATGALATSDAETREAIAWLLDCVSGHSEDLAQAVVDANALPALVACLEYSEVALKRASTAALGSTAQHGERFAHAVASAGAMPPLIALVAQGETGDVRLSRNVLCTLSQIMQGRSHLAAQFVSSGALPSITRCLGSADDLVRRFAAAAIRDIASHGEELAQAVVNSPRCLQLLVDSTRHAKGLNALPAVMALGHCASWDASLAEAIIVADGLSVLTVSLAHSKDEPVKCASAWALGQAGKHCPTHAQAVAESGALLALTGQESADSTGGGDLPGKCSKAACAVISQLATLPALDALLRMPLSVRVKLATLERIAAVLACDSANFKAAFVQSGGLQLVLELGEEQGSPFQAAVAEIAALYPQELVNRFSPAYNRSLLERIAMLPSCKSPATCPPPELPKPYSSPAACPQESYSPVGPSPASDKPPSDHVRAMERADNSVESAVYDAGCGHASHYSALEAEVAEGAEAEPTLKP